jgi:AraC-like DNA-binding protein
MIRSERRVEAPRLGAHLSNTAFVHSGLRLHVVHNRRVINEDILLTRAFARSGRTSRPTATVLLEGRARVSAHGRDIWMTPGEIVTVDSKGAIQMRQEGDPYVALALEWDPGPFGERGEPITLRDGRAHLAALQSVARGIGDERADATGLVATLLHVLAGLGVPVRAVSAASLDEPVGAHMQELTGALDASLSSLRKQPMIVDLAARLGLSSRQLNRLVADYNQRYGFNSLGWIDTRNRRRLLIGATFMTAPGATVGYVATRVGYRSGSTFARALRLVGLPAPQDIAAEVDRIGRATMAVSLDSPPRER